MYKSLVKISLVVIGIIGGCALSYTPALSVVADARRQIDSDNVKPEQLITLRGIIKTIDPRGQYLVVQGISPYSTHESAPFRIDITEKTLLFSAPPTPNAKDIFISVANPKPMKKDGLAVGAPVLIQIGAIPGEFRAYAIATVEAVN